MSISILHRTSWIYFLVAAADILAVSFMPDARMVTKPILMIVLGVLFYQWTHGADWTRRYLFLTALFFAWLGDCLLLFDHAFLFGLGSFLIMQILYVSIFRMDKSFFGVRERLILGILGILVGFIYYFHGSNFGSMGLAVGLYIASIVFMCFTAHARDKRYSGHRYVSIGTVLFIISDSVLGINMFTAPIPLGGVIVMITYLTAQYLIAFGYALFLRSRTT